jgi:hypothetical protein
MGALDQADANLARLMYLRSRTALLINPNKSDHRLLLDLLDTVVSLAPAFGPEQVKSTNDAQSQITVVAQQILKREWERVKKGEPDQP